MTLKKRTIGVWGREILAAPGKLVATLADGKELTAEGVETSTRFDQEHRKIVEVASRLGDVAVASEVRAEFDGLYKVTMSLTPKQPTALKSLRVVLPYTQDIADYIHACTAEIRSGYYDGFTPTGTGRVWDCRPLGDKTMRVGSFIPYVWLGSSKGGLRWFADSDQGWIPNDETPAIEIQRNANGQVVLVFNLVGAEATLDGPRTILGCRPRRSRRCTAAGARTSGGAATPSGSTPTSRTWSSPRSRSCCRAIWKSRRRSLRRSTRPACRPCLTSHPRPASQRLDGAGAGRVRRTMEGDGGQRPLLRRLAQRLHGPQLEQVRRADRHSGLSDSKDRTILRATTFDIGAPPSSTSRIAPRS